MEAKFSELVSYFEDIAKKHKEILHKDNEKHFYRFELDEVLTAMCNDINYPAMILEGYTLDYSDSNADNVIKRRSGGFILLDHVDDTKDYDEIHAVWDKLEAIGDDILVKILDDKRTRATKVVRDFDIANCNGQPLEVQELGQYGIRFSFEVGSSKSNDLEQDKWL